MIETMEEAREVLHKARLSAFQHRDAKLEEQLRALSRFLEGASDDGLLAASLPAPCRVCGLWRRTSKRGRPAKSPGEAPAHPRKGKKAPAPGGRP